MERLFAWILRRRALVLALLVGVTAWMGSFLYPIERVKFDVSFDRLFLSFGGNQDHLRQFREDFGDDVGLVSVLFVLPDPHQEHPPRQVTGTVFEPTVIRALANFTRGLKAVKELDPDQVVGLPGLAKLHDSVELHFILRALETLEEAANKHPGWSASRAITVVEGQSTSLIAPPFELSEAVRAYQGAKAAMLRHRLYQGAVFNPQATATGVIARFRPEYPDDADRKAVISALSNGEGLSATDQERLASLSIKKVLDELPAGTEAHLSGVPVIQKTYTDITLHDMGTYVPLISLAMALLLFLLFRSWWATVLPMVAVGFATALAMGFMQWRGEPINVITSVIPVLILVIGVADAIHIIARYFQVSEEVADKREAVIQTMVHMAPPCLLAALTTIVGFASLLSANIPSIRTFGTYSAYAIFFAFLVQMTLVPIGLSWVPKPKARVPRKAQSTLTTRFFDWVTFVVLQRRRTILLSALVVLLLAAWGVTKLSDESHVLEELHADHPVSQALFLTQEHLTGVLVHSVAFHGKEVAGTHCAVDADCVDAACEPADCPTVGCCETQICKVVDPVKRMLTQLRLNKIDLTDENVSPRLDELNDKLDRLRSRALAMSASSPEGAGRAVSGPEDDALIIEEDDTLIIEEDDGPGPAALENTGPPVAVKKLGVCFESVKNPAFVRKIAALDDWLTESETHRAIVSRVMTLADILREMHLAIVGSEDDENYQIPPTLSRGQIEELLKELKGDPGNVVGRLLTDDYTRTNLTIQANDAGTKAWSALEAELQARLQADFEGDPELAGKFDFHITGSSTLAHGALHSIVHDMSTSIALAFLFIWMLISVLFRSVRVGFIAMVPNLWPLLITLGIMGFAGISLRVSSVIIFTISLGIAVDDTIHYLARLREESRRGLSLEEILRRTTHGTGRAVVLTTVILVTGLSVNGLSDFIAMEQFGLLSAFTLSMALVGVLFLLPVLVQIFRVDKKLSRPSLPDAKLQEEVV